MVLNKIYIENFKGIEKCTLELQPGFNLLIGDNGLGKTSILEAISVGLGGFVAGIEEIATKHFTTDEIRIVLERQGEGSFNRRYITPVSVKCEAVIEGEKFEWTRKKNSLKASRSTVEPRNICKKAYEMANEENHILPLLSYQSTARMWMQKREASENIFAGKFYRTVGYESCLVEASNIKMLMNWVRHMERIEWKRKETIGEYFGVKNALCTFMRSMLDDGVVGVEYDDPSDEIIFITPNNPLPIRYLSAGYQSLIWMVFDIAYRMSLLNPNLLEKINETPGIILIDELDMHLHPKWQWKIVEALKSTFPNVQFIAATHSPIIIASCRNENLITLKYDGLISYADTPYGLDVNDTLNVFQKSLTMAEDVSELLGDFYRRLDEEKLEEAEQVLEKLKVVVGENNPKVTSAGMALELEKIPLED